MLRILRVVEQQQDLVQIQSYGRPQLMADRVE